MLNHPWTSLFKGHVPFNIGEAPKRPKFFMCVVSALAYDNVCIICSVSKWSRWWTSPQKLSGKGSDLDFKMSKISSNGWLKPPTTLPETNIESENEWLEDEFPFAKAHFQGLCETIWLISEVSLDNCRSTTGTVPKSPGWIPPSR